MRAAGRARDKSPTARISKACFAFRPCSVAAHTGALLSVNTPAGCIHNNMSTRARAANTQSRLGNLRIEKKSPAGIRLTCPPTVCVYPGPTAPACARFPAATHPGGSAAAVQLSPCAERRVQIPRRPVQHLSREESADRPSVSHRQLRFALSPLCQRTHSRMQQGHTGSVALEIKA